MPRFKVIIEIDAPDENQASFMTYADTYVHSKIVKLKGHSTKACKCNVLYDGKLLNTSGGRIISFGTTFRSLTSAKRLINKLIVLYAGKYDPKLFIIVKV